MVRRPAGGGASPYNSIQKSPNLGRTHSGVIFAKTQRRVRRWKTCLSTSRERDLEASLDRIPKMATLLYAPSAAWWRSAAYRHKNAEKWPLDNLRIKHRGILKFCGETTENHEKHTRGNHRNHEQTFEPPSGTTKNHSKHLHAWERKSKRAPKRKGGALPDHWLASARCLDGHSRLHNPTFPSVLPPYVFDEHRYPWLHPIGNPIVWDACVRHCWKMWRPDPGSVCCDVAAAHARGGGCSLARLQNAGCVQARTLARWVCELVH